MAENLLVVGDVHGCYNTFKSLVETHWNPEESILIQLGDMVDRGKFTPETVAFARELERAHPEKTVFLKGNHDAELAAYWEQCVAENNADAAAATDETLRQYNRRLGERADDMRWLGELPLYWANDDIFVSHAGIAALWDNWEEALQENHPNGILWTRLPLKNLGKLQIVGHTPQIVGEPLYTPASRSWNIDTAAVFGVTLSALKISPRGETLQIISAPTDRRDLLR